METMKMGAAGILSGCLLMLFNTTVGMIVLVGGIALLAFGSEEKPQTENKNSGVDTSNIRYKVVENKMLMLDKDGNVLATRELEQKQEKPMLENKRRKVNSK